MIISLVKCEIKVLILFTPMASPLKFLEWIGNFISHVIMDIITYLSWYSSSCMLVKGTPGGEPVMFLKN